MCFPSVLGLKISTVITAKPKYLDPLKRQYNRSISAELVILYLIN